jgi:hypothetical protein
MENGDHAASIAKVDRQGMIRLFQGGAASTSEPSPDRRANFSRRNSRGK